MSNASDPIPQPQQPLNTNQQSISTHHMTTRAKAGIFKPRHQLDLAHTSSHALYSTLFAQKDPKGFKSAAKNPKWMLAMHEEMTALQQNDTWVLGPRPNIEMSSVPNGCFAQSII